MKREARDMRERRDPKFKIQGSKFRKPRTFARLGFPASLACLARLSGVPTKVFRSLLDDFGLGHKQHREGNAAETRRVTSGNALPCEPVVKRRRLEVKRGSFCPSREPREDGEPG